MSADLRFRGDPWLGVSRSEQTGRSQGLLVPEAPRGEQFRRGRQETPRNGMTALRMPTSYQVPDFSSIRSLQCRRAESRPQHTPS
jgi:hypothetical protein